MNTATHDTATLDTLSEREVATIRAAFKAETWSLRIVDDVLGREASVALDTLTTYMHGRFPRRGSTPVCSAVS